MNVDAYLAILGEMEDEYASNLPMPYWSLFARRWFRVTAPSKTEDYGTDAWERMGSRGILAELSGCHYRCRRFRQRGAMMSRGLGGELSPGEFYDPVYDALLDSFGYSVMLRVCVALEGRSNQTFDWRMALSSAEPTADNEWLLENYWDAGRPLDAFALPIALRSALNSWRLLT